MMIPKTPRPALATRTRSPLLGAVAIALALSGCVPVPLMEKAYVPDKRDVEAATTRASGCAFNEAKTDGVRHVGNVKILTSLYVPERGKPDARAFLHIDFHQTSTSGKYQNVAVNPARVTLHDGGRSSRARLENQDTYRRADGKSTSTWFRLEFPARSAIGRDVKVVFDAGAIRIGGQTVSFAPIRFQLKESPLVYMFPCIPA